MKKYARIIFLILISYICYGIIQIEAGNFIKLPTDKVFATVNTSRDVTIFINESASGKKGTFYLGMLKEDVLSKLSDLRVETDKIEITNTHDAWDYGNDVYETEELSFTFDKNDRLYKITVWANIPTVLGLKFGDSLKDMERLYGKNYILHQTDNENIYEYIISDHYFRVFIIRIPNGKIEGWEISKYDENGKDIDKNPSTNSSSILQNNILALDYAKHYHQYPGGKELPQGEQQKQISKAKALSDEGLNYYKDKKDNLAIAKYEEALTHYASAEIYYRYGNSLSNIPRLDDAVKAYQIAIELKYDKPYLIYYNIACAHSRMKNDKEAFANLELALNKGYKNLDYIQKDGDLAFLRSLPEWKDWWDKHK